jgi:hypothetical protein
MKDELPQHHEKFVQQYREADDEAEIKRRPQPAAVEQHALKPLLEAIQTRV